MHFRYSCPSSSIGLLLTFFDAFPLGFLAVSLIIPGSPILDSVADVLRAILNIFPPLLQPLFLGPTTGRFDRRTPNCEAVLWLCSTIKSGWISKREWIALHVRVRIQAAFEANGIGFRVPPRLRVIVSEVVVVL
jgi:hypothetical protein